MRVRQASAASACLLAAAALVAGCGSGSGSTSGSSGSASAESRPAPPKSEFPSARGKTLADVINSTEGPSELVVSPAAEAFYTGENRYPFGVFERDRSQVADAKVALYFAKVPTPKQTVSAKPGDPAKGGTTVKKAEEKALDQPAIGPFPAAVESLQTEPAFRAQTTASDPNAATVVYTTEINFPSNGEWRIAAVVKQGDKTTGTLLPSAEVGQFPKVPRVGQKAPFMHTPTPASVGGDLAKITTRIPPDTQNEVDYADVLGKEPIVLLFATPQFCQSRVCGPVVDVAEQVKQIYGDKAKFIHMEIYNENNPSKGVRPQVKAFHLPSEPWLFVIDRQGVIRKVIEGAFGVDQLTEAVKGVTGE
ncbi:MAG TPA: hypothetical protein VII45_07695 [Solirubrobacterales bacterium]